MVGVSETGFPFEEGDIVTVTADGHSTDSPIGAEFTAECRDISGRPGPASAVARFSLPFGTMNSVTIRPYEGEFEVASDD